MMMRRIGLTLALAGFFASPAAAERFNHNYDMSVGGLRLASANIAAVVENGRYAINAAMNARGIIGALTGGSFTASVQGTHAGGADLRPERFEQTSDFRGEQETLVIRYAGGAPVSTIYTPERDADDDPIPTLSKQAGTVDFLTAMMTLTLPGTAAEICDRSVVAFTFTKRTAIDGTGTVGGTAEEPVCTVRYANVDPETLVREEDDTYTLSLRRLNGDRFEVERISGPTEYGRAIFRRTN